MTLIFTANAKSAGIYKYHVASFAVCAKSALISPS